MITLADYQIERSLWQNEHYEVSLATHKRTKRVVEIWWCDEPASVDAFYHALPRLQRFKNHRIADVLDGGITDGGAAWFACEHFDGTPLSDLMAAGPSHAVFAIEAMLGICEGLKEAHAAGLTHGDIHPRHIIVMGDDDVRLCGLGAVRLFGLPKSKAMVSPAYRAPEALDGSGISELTDIYSIGVILYHLIAGKAAFRNDVLDVFNRIPEPLHDANTPEFIWRVIRRAIKKSPTERYRSMDEFLALLHDTHGHYFLFLETIDWMATRKDAFERADRSVKRPGDRESGNEWSRTVQKMRRGPAMPPARSESPSPRPARRRWPVRRVLEVGTLLALLGIAGAQIGHLFTGARPVSSVARVPRLMYALAVPFQEPAVSTPTAATSEAPERPPPPRRTPRARAELDVRLLAPMYECGLTNSVDNSL